MAKIDKTQVAKKVASFINQKGGQATQKEIMDLKLAGAKVMREVLSNHPMLEKHGRPGKPVTWHLKESPKSTPKVDLDTVVETTEGNGKPIDEDQAEQQGETVAATRAELITAFNAVGMTKSRSRLMAKKIVQGELTEKQVMDEWAKNPSNPNLSKQQADAAAAEVADDLAAADKGAEEAKAKAEAEKAKNKRQPAKVNFWGHREGTQADAIDRVVKPILDKGTKEISIPFVSEKTGLNGGRVSLHLNHLIKKKGIDLIVVKTKPATSADKGANA